VTFSSAVPYHHSISLNPTTHSIRPPCA
jgi:hypothetical protein